MKTPEKTTAAFSRYMTGRVTADSAALRWPSLYVRCFQFPRVVDRFLVPATAEPHISCGIAGRAQFQERERGGEWTTRRIGLGDLFVTRSRTPLRCVLYLAPRARIYKRYRSTSRSLPTRPPDRVPGFGPERVRGSGG